jgi:hypothetical protein
MSKVGSCHTFTLLCHSRMVWTTREGSFFEGVLWRWKKAAAYCSPFWFKYLWVYIFELFLEVLYGRPGVEFPSRDKRKELCSGWTHCSPFTLLCSALLICLEKHSQTFPVGYKVTHHCCSFIFMESTAPGLSRGHRGFIKSSAPRKECLPFSKRQGCTWILCQGPFSVFPFHAWQFL